MKKFLCVIFIYEYFKFPCKFLTILSRLINILSKEVMQSKRFPSSDIKGSNELAAAEDYF